MIIDDLRKHLPKMAGAQVFRVPYEVCPARFDPNTDSEGNLAPIWDGTGIPAPAGSLTVVAKDPEGFEVAKSQRYHALLSWKEWTGERRAIVPTTQGAISTEGWRPPFEKMWIASERCESGAIAIEMIPPADGIDWNALVSAYGLGPDGKLIALAVGGMSSERGVLHAISRDLDGMAVRGPLGPQARSFGDLHDRLEADDADYDAAKEWWLRDVANCALVVATTCSLLSCRNVTTEVVRPAEKLQRARVRRGELPLVSFHVLKVTGPSVRQASNGSGGGQPLAVHWVRGHFKRYGEENRLFGKLTGLYWWSPHLAGKSDRVVLKDYAVEDAGET